MCCWCPSRCLSPQQRGLHTLPAKQPLCWAGTAGARALQPCPLNILLEIEYKENWDGLWAKGGTRRCSGRRVSGMLCCSLHRGSTTRQRLWSTPVGLVRHFSHGLGAWILCLKWAKQHLLSPNATQGSSIRESNHGEEGENPQQSEIKSYLLWTSQMRLSLWHTQEI